MSTHNRAAVVEQTFVDRVGQGTLPEGPQFCSLAEAGLSAARLVDLFESQLISRRLDILARQLRARDATYYTIGSAGHEGNAAVAAAFRHTDFSFLHYRSGAFFVHRSKQLPGTTPVFDLLLSFAASAHDPIAEGRHKVLGSVPLCVPPQTSTIASHIPKAVGAALSIDSAAKNELADPAMAPDGVVICSFGDASFNHATAQSGLNLASLMAYQGKAVPLVFVCEDNGIGISVPTPDNWIANAVQGRPGLKFLDCDGRDLIHTFVAASAAAYCARTHRQPVFLRMRTVRLLGHAGSDVEALYRSQKEIEAVEADDPLLHSARLVLEHTDLSRQDILTLHDQVRQRCEHVAEVAIARPRLKTPKQVMAAIKPPENLRPEPGAVDGRVRKALFAKEHRNMEKPQHMAKLLNWGLTDVMLKYKNTVVFGEDVGKKGGVYHVTAGLQERLGTDRVFDTPLDETSILGQAIGYAHNGFVPIPEIQFLAYLHNAEDQLRGEAATLSFFSAGQFQNPMVIRIAGLAYQRGFGGHFHNDNSLAVLRDLPGVIVGVPSRGDDAVRMLRGAVQAAHCHGRVVVMVEPIALYMTKDLHEPGDSGWSFPYPDQDEVIEPGEFALHGDGSDLLVITYGNGTYYSLQAQKTLQDEHKVEATVLDLRWLAPLDEAEILKVAKGFKKVMVVDECRQTGSVSEQIVALLAEQLPGAIKFKRVAADDSFIPLGPAATCVLPKPPRIVHEALDLISQKPARGTRRKVLRPAASDQ